MRHHPNYTVQIERRIFHFEQTAKVETRRLRNKLISELDDLFDIATSIAKGKTS